MRWSLRALVLLLVAVAGVKLWTYRLENSPLPPPNPIVVKALTAPRPTVDVPPLSSSEAWTNAVRRQCMTPLDTLPGEWFPAVEKVKHPGDQSLKCALSDMAAPTTQDIQRLKRETPIVRRVPFPFYSILSVPSDCCGTSFLDPLYSHAVFSRQYGLDLTSSFYPFCGFPGCDSSGGNFAMFRGRSPNPFVYSVEIEEQSSDVFPLLLTMLYRGWVDHIHSWSSESGFPCSEFEPITVTVPSTGEAQASLVVQGCAHGVDWQGLVLSLSLDDKVSSFELVLTDTAELNHVIARGAALEARSGWDISEVSHDKLDCLYVSLDQEQNKNPAATLGRVSREHSGDWKGATLRVRGKPGAVLQLKSIRKIDITREMIERQMDVMRQFNVLPTTATSHGGLTSWTSIDEMGSLAYHDGDKSCQAQRPPGAIADGSPAYCLDLMLKFGIVNFNQTHPTTGAALRVIRSASGVKYYQSQRWILPGLSVGIPSVNSPAWGDGLGAMLATMLASRGAICANQIAYTHFNIYPPELKGQTGGSCQLNEFKILPPLTHAGLQLLSDAKFDLRGKAAPHQRVWVPPLPANLRFAAASRELPGHVHREGNTVRIDSWKDEVTGKPCPEAGFETQDLHGQTFYVDDPQAARVFVDKTEIDSLKRNPADLTGRPSVTIVDTSWPTIAFDEVDLYEMNGDLRRNQASYYFRNGHARRGKYAMEVQCENDQAGWIEWRPFLFDTHETDYVRFSYKKTNPDSQAFCAWSADGKTWFVATEGDLKGRQGWRIPHHADREYHDLTLDFADMQPPAHGNKQIPRCRVQNIYFGLTNARRGDSVFFDRVEFLSARGIRPTAGAGLVIGGRLIPPRDQQAISVEYNGQRQSTTTARGGWYIFHDVPRDAVVAITTEIDGVTYYPAAGRLAQVGRNSMEHHIFIGDPRCPSMPRPKDWAKSEVTDELKPVAVAPPPELKRQYAAPFAPHSERFYAGNVGWKFQYMAREQVNNHGVIDKDRRFDNPDRAFRVLLLGECWTEGAQTPTCQHYNVLLESLLRRKFGVPVEVATFATSNSSVGTNSEFFEGWGVRYKPDLVLLMSDCFNVLSLEPKLQEKSVGWVAQHAPYRMFDFDKRGELIVYPPDPQYGAFTVRPDPIPLVSPLTLTQTYFVLGEYPALIERSFSLLEAVLRQRYMARLQPFGGHLAVAYGYSQYHYPNYRGAAPPIPLAAERFFDRMVSTCQSVGATPMNLSDDVFDNEKPERMIWEKDAHLTPYGHARIATALAGQIEELPEFKAYCRQVHEKRP